MAEIVDQNEQISNRIAEETTEGTMQEEYDKLSSTGSTNMYAPVNIKATEEANKPKATRKRTTGKQAVQGKPGNCKDLIADMKEKVAAIEYIDSAVPDMEIPSQSPAKIREVLLQLQKDIWIAKGTAINTIMDKS